MGAVGSADPAPLLTRRWVGAALVVAALTVAVVVGLGVYADFHALREALTRFDWWLFPVALALTSVNYAVRFVRWERYLGAVRIEVPVKRSLSIYLSGQAMSVSPAKLGEILKSVLLRRGFGVPIVRSAPIVVAERVTDAVGIVVLAAAAGLVAGSDAGRGLSLAGLVGAALVVAAFRVPWPARLAPLAEARTAGRELFTTRLVVGMSGLGALSWFFECLAAYACVRGLGMDASLAVTTLAFSLGSLAGALAFVPGGLGVAEASMTALFITLAGASRADAVAATLLIRLSTLWFAVLLGLVALVVELRLENQSVEPVRRSSMR